jgi:hypothetical protein
LLKEGEAIRLALSASAVSFAQRAPQPRSRNITFIPWKKLKKSEKAPI